MGSSLSIGEKILKIDDLFLRIKIETKLEPLNDPISDFEKSVLGLSSNLISFMNQSNKDFIFDSEDSTLRKIFGFTRQSIDALDRIISDLNSMLKNKKLKIDGKLDYIFEKSLEKKGIRGKNKSEAFLGFVEELIEQALDLFKHPLEKLYKEPLLRLDIDSLGGNREELPELINSLSVEVERTQKLLVGNPGVFTRGVKDVHALWDNFFKLGTVIGFDEICQEYKKLNEDAVELAKAIKKGLKTKSLQYFAEKQREQGLAAPINPNQLKDKFGEKQARLLTILFKLHNFHVDFNRAKMELMNWVPGVNDKENIDELYNRLNLLDKYFRLSDDLVGIAAARNPEIKKGGLSGGVYGGQMGGDWNLTKHRNYLMWFLLIGIGLIIIIMILLWKNDEIIAKKNTENISSSLRGDSMMIVN